MWTHLLRWDALARCLDLHGCRRLLLRLGGGALDVICTSVRPGGLRIGGAGRARGLGGALLHYATIRVLWITLNRASCVLGLRRVICIFAVAFFRFAGTLGAGVVAG